MKPLIVSLCTHWSPTFENCRRSFHVHDYNYTILGWGQQWKGWKWRCQIYLDHLNTLSNDTLVVLMDSCDTFMVKSNHDLIETFLAFNRPIVIGCEWWCGGNNCGKVEEWWKINKKQSAHRKYVNAGVIVGYVKELKLMYKWVIDYDYTDDQKGIADYINTYGHDSVALDYGSSLIYNGHILDGYKVNKTAVIHHYPGILLKLGFMPLYNKTVQQQLGTYARKVYPDFKQEVILKFIVLLSFMYLCKKIFF